MAIYHITKAGEPGRCRAFLRECPYGGPEAHYLSKVDALRSYELKQGGSFGSLERAELVIIEENEIRIIDSRLLNKARKMAEASGAELVEIEATTQPLAIIRAARVETIVQLQVAETISYPQVPNYDVLEESPD